MIIAADNLRITDSTIAMAIERYDPAPIAAMVRRCEAAGADWIDLNAGPLSREPEKHITFLVETVCAVTRLPLLLDTANPRALGAGLAASRNLPNLLGFPVRTIAGLSNLSTGRMPKPVKHLLQRAFLPMLAAAGLSCALMDALQPETVQTARACKAMCDPGIFSWGQLTRP